MDNLVNNVYRSVLVKHSVCILWKDQRLLLLQTLTIIITVLWITIKPNHQLVKATSIPPNKQFCLLVKIVWKDQLFFFVAYQNHIFTETLSPGGLLFRYVLTCVSGNSLNRVPFSEWCSDLSRSEIRVSFFFAEIWNKGTFLVTLFIAWHCDVHENWRYWKKRMVIVCLLLFAFKLSDLYFLTE